MRLLILLLLITVVSAQPKLGKNEWQSFKEQHGKKYANETEEFAALDSYIRNKGRIEEHNDLFVQGMVSFEMGINKYSDVPHEDFVRAMNGFMIPDLNSSLNNGAKHTLPVDVEALPTSVDWRYTGYVTKVRDQGPCAACWAFSAVGSLEGQYFSKTQTLASLSEQHLIDCAGSTFGNNGCRGGYMNNAFNFVQSNKGISAGKSYPYAGRQRTCKRTKNPVDVSVTGFVSVPKGNEVALQHAVATVGPVSVAMDASLQSFQAYRKGIYYDAACSSTKLDHAVLLVGYGTSSAGLDYWLVKNSWGKSWGVKGYARIARNRNNHCGIATLASYPIV